MARYGVMSSWRARYERERAAARRAELEFSEISTRAAVPPAPATSRIAVHEAAHCVVAMAYGVDVEFATLRQGAPGLPDTIAHMRSSTKGRTPWIGAVISAAGIAADIGWFGLTDYAHAADLEQVRAALRREGEDSATLDRRLGAAEAAAVQILFHNTAAVFRLADKLDAARELTGQEVRRIAGKIVPATVRAEPLLATVGFAVPPIVCDGQRKDGWMGGAPSRAAEHRHHPGASGRATPPLDERGFRWWCLRPSSVSHAEWVAMGQRR